MMINTGTAGKWALPTILPIALLLALTSCAREEAVSFSQDVKPIIDKNCLACHKEGGKGFEASGFSMVTYDELMKGTKFGPMIIAGDSAGSNMIVLMARLSACLTVR